MGKKILSVALLAFVAIALVALLMRGQGDGGGSAAQSPPAPVAQGDAPVAPGASVAAAEPTAPASRLVAFYFHGSKRCTSCNSIENLTREALKIETEAARIEIRSVNVDESANAHYVDDFQLTMRTVVLAEERGGTVVRWMRLDECWDRLGDPADFQAYVQRSLAGFREPTATAR